MTKRLHPPVLEAKDRIRPLSLEQFVERSYFPGRFLSLTMLQRKGNYLCSDAQTGLTA